MHIHPNIICIPSRALRNIWWWWALALVARCQGVATLPRSCHACTQSSLRSFQTLARVNQFASSDCTRSERSEALPARLYIAQQATSELTSRNICFSYRLMVVSHNYVKINQYHYTIGFLKRVLTRLFKQKIFFSDLYAFMIIFNISSLLVKILT